MSDLIQELKLTIGEELFQVLVDPANTKEVQKLCEQIMIRTITIGGRTYEIVPFNWVFGVPVSVNIEAAKKLNACLGEEDAKHFVQYQGEIPVFFRDRCYFVFPNYDLYGAVYHFNWTGTKWSSGYGLTYARVKLLRRIQ
jgi:hypothetical protein